MCGSLPWVIGSGSRSAAIQRRMPYSSANWRAVNGGQPCEGELCGDDPARDK